MVAVMKDGLTGLITGHVPHTLSGNFAILFCKPAIFTKFMSHKHLYTYGCTVHKMCMYSFKYRNV